MNEKLREALSLALQYVPAESKNPLEQEEIDKIHLLVKEGTKAIPIEPPVKPANDDFAIIACMYAILQTQEAAIWNKISGKTTEANEMANKLIPQIEKVTQMIEKRLSV